MEEPDALKEDYFFRREALRYELESEDEELSLEGTVFNEDWGHLTDIQENADSFIMLYFSAQNNVRLIYTPFSQPGKMPRTGQEEHRARAWIVTLNRTCRQAVLQGRKTLG